MPLLIILIAMFGTSTIDIGDPTTMLAFVGDFFTSFKSTVSPIILWGMGLILVLSIFGIIFAFVRKGHHAVAK